MECPACWAAAMATGSFLSITVNLARNLSSISFSCSLWKWINFLFTTKGLASVTYLSSFLEGQVMRFKNDGKRKRGRFFWINFCTPMKFFEGFKYSFNLPQVDNLKMESEVLQEHIRDKNEVLFSPAENVTWHNNRSNKIRKTLSTAFAANGCFVEWEHNGQLSQVLLSHWRR